MRGKIIRQDLIYPELSYRVMGVLFEVWKVVGFGHKESFYQRAVAKELDRNGLQFKEQLPAEVRYKGSTIGRYRFDFLVENKIVLEIKVRNFFSKQDIQQTYSYLKARNLTLGIIAHFTATGVKFKRVLNVVEH